MLTGSLGDHGPASAVAQVSGLAVAISGRPVLRGIDLTVTEGSFVAVMGANGSGKSTLVRALVGLLPTTSGEVALFGTPLARFRDWHRIGFVPQRAGATGGVPASVREVVAAGRLSRRRVFAVESRADRIAVDAAIETVGLAGRAREGIATLSGGQQQRVLIARALAGEPDLVILDEPTAGVDLPNQEALADALGALSGLGASVVLVAHELGPLAALVGRAVVLRDGRIAYDGPALGDEAVHQPEYGEPSLAALTEGHSHHHHDSPPSRVASPADHGSHDHAPHVASPLDVSGGTS